MDTSKITLKIKEGRDKETQQWYGQINNKIYNDKRNKES